MQGYPTSVQLGPIQLERPARSNLPDSPIGLVLPTGTRHACSSSGYSNSVGTVVNTAEREKNPGFIVSLQFYLILFPFLSSQSNDNTDVFSRFRR